MTGVHITELDRLKGYKAGAVDYVYIPVVPEILRSKVAVLVELYRKRRELRALNATWPRPTSAWRGQHRAAGGEDPRAREHSTHPCSRPTRNSSAPTSHCKAR